MNDDRIIQVPLHAIHPHPRNTEFFDDADQESFARLKESIAEIGMLTPIRVSKDYTIISGHQRYRACKELGVEFVGVIVDTELDDENEMLMQLIVSNFGRAKNDPIKQGKMIEEYETLCGISRGRPEEKSGNNFRISQEDIAKEFGCDARTLRNLKRLTKLPPEVQEIIRAGKISPTTAVKSLASLPVEDQLKVIASLPEAKSRFTQAAVQAQVDKLRTAAIERDQAIERAEEMQRELNAQIDTAETSIHTLRAQLDEANQKLQSAPAVVEVIPDDYEEVKQKASQVAKLEFEIGILQGQLAQAEAKLTPEPAKPVLDPDDGMVGPRVTIEKLNQGLKYFAPPVKEIVGNPDLLRNLDLSQRRGLASVLFDLADDMHQIVRSLQADPGFTY